jgi:GntR family transcriptional regulator/MocR family aminotransferase
VSKTITSFDLVLATPPKGASLFGWLCDELRSAILDGRLRRGTRLPSTRELARCSGVSRGTVVTAFDQLHSEGYLEGKTGSGTCVNSLLPEDLLHARRAVERPVCPKRSSKSLSQYARRLPVVPQTQARPARAFRAAEAGLDAFPLNLWAKISSRCLRRATRSLLSDADPCGYRPLREAISDYLGTARGVRCTSEQVIVVAGIQQALACLIHQNRES